MPPRSRRLSVRLASSTAKRPKEKKPSRGVVAVQLGLPRPALRKRAGFPAAVSFAMVMMKSLSSNGLRPRSARISSRDVRVALRLAGDMAGEDLAALAVGPRRGWFLPDVRA